MIRYRIVSDGTSLETVILDLETKKPVPGVKSIEWRVSAPGYATATVVLNEVAISADVDNPEIIIEAPTNEP